MNTRNMMIGGLTAIAGVAVMRTMQNNGTKRKVKKAVNKAFNTVTDSVQNMNMK
ncbi:hypothetical protein [Alkalibaculum sporogenes]|uniref:hypothetical protein n=1 Tax=Alkalibaculum sporogenes TaxID=2655001 RepID=UPI00187B2F8D|nr:hypothetical protein [Alkalibaculum sporogenes]